MASASIGIASTVTGKAQMTPTGTLSERHAKQLLARGLEPELALRYGWISAGPLTDGIAIPYLMDGKVVNHKYRTLNGEKKFAQDKDAVKCFWNFDALKNESGPIVITEGECDALAGIQAGYLRTVSVPGGAPSTPSVGDGLGPQYAFLDSALPLMRGSDEIILATDGDGPGDNLFHGLLLRLGRARCKFVTYPLKRDGTRCKDLNDALQVYGPEGVRQTLDRAQWAKLGGVYRMSELPPLPEHAVMELGFESSIGRLAKARRGDFWVVSGPPGHGKTAFMLDAVCRVVMAHNLRVAWASFENLPQQDLKRQLRKWFIATQRAEGGAHPADIRQPWCHADVTVADAWIEAHFRFLVPDPDEDVTFDWFLERVNAAVIREECDVVLLDPWNELDHAPGDMALTTYVGEAIKKMKQTARKLQVWWIVIAHPAKMRTGDQLSLYSISDSAHWFNKADIGLLINREGDGAGAKIICAKARYEEIGSRGEANALFNAETRRFNVPVEIGVDP
jgi:twinkle protein